MKDKHNLNLNKPHMINSFRHLTFDKIIKTVLLLFICYFLFLLTKIATTMQNNSEVGRYQFDNDGHYVIDSKTGETRVAEY